VVGVEADLGRSDDLAVDDDGSVTLSFDTGLRASVRATWRAVAATWDAQAASATSAVRLELVPEPSVELNGAALKLPPAPPGLATDQLHHLGFVGQMAALGDDIAARRAPAVGPAFGRLVLDVLCAAYASAGTGAPEAVPFSGRRDLTPHQLWRAG
jgi:predicted dehydrogenase